MGSTLILGFLMCLGFRPKVQKNLRGQNEGNDNGQMPILKFFFFFFFKLHK
jgi:hypothetical protein